MTKAERITQAILRSYFDDQDLFQSMDGVLRERAVKAAEDILNEQESTDKSTFVDHLATEVMNNAQNSWSPEFLFPLQHLMDLAKQKSDNSSSLFCERVSHLLGQMKHKPSEEKPGYMHLTLNVQDRYTLLMASVRIGNPTFYKLCK